MTRPRYVCPNCGSHNLEVNICATAKLVQQDDGNFETEVTGDHEWDGNSTMVCTVCGLTDKLGRFSTPYWGMVDYLDTLDLASALWWFIENFDADHKDRNDIFFYLRERVRTETK